MDMPVKVTGQQRSEGELFLDMELAAGQVARFADQAFSAIARENGVEVQDGADVQAAVEEALSDKPVAEIAAGTVMNMAAPFGRSTLDDVSTVGAPRFIAHGKLEAGKPFAFTASWALVPQAELSSYEPVEFNAPASEVAEEAIDREIAQMRAQGARFAETHDDGPVRRGDAVDLSLDTEHDGEKVDGLCFETRAYVTGAGNMPDEFEDNVVGMRPGETKTFTYKGVVGIDEDGQAVYGDYTSTVHVRAKLEQDFPEIDDAWVRANVSGCDGVQELRARIRERMAGQAGEERRHYLNYLAASKLAERFEGHIPDAAYEAVREQLQAELEDSARQAGMGRDEFLQEQGMNEQQFGVRMILEAHERLAQSIALDAMARHLGSTLSEEDLEEFYKVQAPAGHEDEYRRQVEQSGHSYLARQGALRLKTSAYLVENAVIHETAAAATPEEKGA